MFFRNGWEKVVKDNCVINGDQLLFIYNDCDICSIVKKNVKKEEDMDMNANAREEGNDDNDHHHTVLSQDMDTTEGEGNCNGGDHHRDASAEKSNIPDYSGADLFLSGRYIQPENPYFVTKIRRTRVGSLYIPREIIMEFNLELPPTVTLCDMIGREWTTNVIVWGDGRTWLSGGWRNLCNLNLVGKEDRCICEFLPLQMENDMVLQVIIVREDDTMQMRKNIMNEKCLTLL
ncbi:PREDICTED: B3 domain-containing protein At5g60130-like [Ipomoea nil]|uniref:B3 domain-containing protein At5g60130-like n=1 Tax=Ipomoea nil TaxID=35883 RepID=UPI000901F189|nr:PREDICTED: B3 domain-containing protein At5g60130-like [Ipomoea nil]